MGNENNVQQFLCLSHGRQSSKRKGLFDRDDLDSAFLKLKSRIDGFRVFSRPQPPFSFTAGDADMEFKLVTNLLVIFKHGFFSLR